MTNEQNKKKQNIMHMKMKLWDQTQLKDTDVDIFNSLHRQLETKHENNGQKQCKLYFLTNVKFKLGFSKPWVFFLPR